MVYELTGSISSSGSTGGSASTSRDVSDSGLDLVLGDVRDEEVL